MNQNMNQKNALIALTAALMAAAALLRKDDRS